MELKEKLESYLKDRLETNVKICNFFSLSGGGGACQDNYMFDLFVEDGEWKGEHNLVLRTDKGASLYASISKQDEFGVTSLAYNNGVKTPRPYWLEKDTTFTGNPFFIMQRISGKANGRHIVKAPSLNKIRKRLPMELGENLAKIHTISQDACTDERLKKVLSADRRLDDSYAKDAVEYIKNQIESLADPHPAMELIINWAIKNDPTPDKIVLVHGDFRTGNFMVSENGLEGILDWEFSHWGDRHEDISWLCMRDWRFGKPNKEVGGFASREEFYEAYEKFSKVPVNPKKVLFWEVIGNLRWAIGSIGQAERHLSGKDKGIELASIGRRTCEMEYEAMRLIENAR